MEKTKLVLSSIGLFVILGVVLPILLWVAIPAYVTYVYWLANKDK